MTNLLAARQMDPAVRIVHNTIRLAGDNGLTEASISVMSGLCPGPLAGALRVGAARGVLSLIDGRWVAWDICPTCGHAADDRDAYDRDAVMHPAPGVCNTPAASRYAGYPATRGGGQCESR